MNAQNLNVWNLTQRREEPAEQGAYDNKDRGTSRAQRAIEKGCLEQQVWIQNTVRLMSTFEEAEPTHMPSAWAAQAVNKAVNRNVKKLEA